jgi:hypothetical protein
MVNNSTFQEMFGSFGLPLADLAVASEKDFKSSLFLAFCLG